MLQIYKLINETFITPLLVLDTFFCNMKRKETHFLSSSIDDSTKTFIKRNHRGKRCIIHDLA